MDATGPAGYPSSYEFDGLLSDGTPVRVRPIRPDDTEALIAFHAGLSPESIRLRYFVFVPELTPARACELTTLDYRGRMAFVALVGDRLVGVVRYERTARPREAEVAFVVTDDLHGRGIATLLFEHLAHYARTQGIERFVAETMPENDKMLNVFVGIGLEQQLRHADGVVEAVFELEPTAAYLDRRDARDASAVLASLSGLFAPRSVAVVCRGLDRPGGGPDLVRRIVAGDFTGTVHPVHPTDASVRAIAAVAGLDELSGRVDLAILDVGPGELPDALDAAAAAGARCALVVSPLEGDEPAEVLARARRARLRLVGPGSGGCAVSDPAVRLLATSSGGPELAPGGRVGLGVQSAAIGAMLVDELDRSGVGISSFVSLGEKLDVSGNDLLCWFESDPATSVVALHLESFGNPAKFARIARRVGRVKPIVMLRTGPLARVPVRPFEASTPAPVLPDPLADPIGIVLGQSGVIEVGRLDELLDVVAVLDRCPPPGGGRVALVGDAAGPLLLGADACEAAGLEVVALLGLDEPAGPAPAGGPAGLEKTLEAVLARDDVDSVLVILTVLRPGVAGPRTDAFADAKPVVVCAPGAPGSGAHVSGAPLGPLKGRAVLTSPERGALALARATRWARWRSLGSPGAPEPAGFDRSSVREVLDAALANSPEGGWLGAADAERLLVALGLSSSPGADAHGAVATVLRLDHEPSIGPLVSFGLSGVASELLGDRTVAVPPVAPQAARALVEGLRAARVLTGWRGARAADTDGLADAICRVALLGELAPEVAELVADPLLADEHGVRVAGIVVRVAPVATGPGPLSRALRAVSGSARSRTAGVGRLGSLPSA